MSATSTYVAQSGESAPYGFLKIVSTCAWGFGYFGMPHILLRFMAIKDENKLKLSRRVASIWVVIAMAMAVFIGIVGNALSKQGIIATLIESDTETIIVRIADLLSQHGIIPALMQLLAASSSVSQNVLQDTLHLNLSSKASMLIARGTVVVIAILGVIIARDPNSSVFNIVSFAWAGFGAAFGPVIICSLFWKRTTLSGAVFGMVAGGATVFIWKYLVAPLGGAFAIYELLPAFLVGTAAIVVVSLLTKKPGAEILAEFEAAKSNSAIN